MSVKQIPLSGPSGRDLFMLVSDEDYELMSRFKWYAKKEKDGTVSAFMSISAHKFLTGYQITDHANGNKLDNTRTNLRDATHRQNSMNRGKRRDATHTYKGVHYSKRRNQFRARIQTGERRIFSPYYESAIDAARAYDAMARKHFDKFARLNFPHEQNYEFPARFVRKCAHDDCNKEFQSMHSAKIFCSQKCADLAMLPEVPPVFGDTWSRPPRSGYKGVNRLGTRWQARIMRNGKRIFLGNFDTPEEAGRAYDTAARSLFGEFAWLNFPD